MNKKILSLALPSIASNITVPLLGLCDVTIMGHIGGATSIAAIAVGSMIFNVMYWLFGFLRMGTSGLTAQAVGRMEVLEVRGQNSPSNLPPLTSHSSPQESHPSPQEFHPSPQEPHLSPLSILKSSLRAALCIGLAIVALQVPLQWLSFWLMQVPDEVYGLCTHYYYICVWGAPAMLGLYSLTGWFIGMQDTRTPMTIAIGQNVLNILLSLFLVIVLHLGIVGVAIGTLVSQWAAFVAVLLRYKSRVKSNKCGYTSHDETVSKSNHTYNFSLFTYYLKIYLDIFLRTLCLVAVNLYFTSAGAAQGALTLAANTLLMQFFMFFSYVMDGFAYAGEALAGKSYGAGDLTTLRRVVVQLFRWGVGVAVVFTAAYWLLGPMVLSLLTSDAQVIATATVYLPWAVLIPAAGMAAFVWDGIYIGLTATRAMLWTCLASAIAFFAVYLLLRPTMANHALWLAMTAYLALRGLLQSVLYKKKLI